jgi:tRNA (mo5U34)-methyltransferase
MVQLLFLDLHKMNRLGSLSTDPILSPYLKALSEKVERRNEEIFSANKKGIALSNVLEKLPPIFHPTTDVDRARIRIGSPDDLDERQKESLYEALCDLKPWRKGPFELFGVPLDAEWDSSIKWDRLSRHLDSLSGKRVLDVGSSCGYYLFRLAALEPVVAIGIEPYLNFYFQFLALSRYLDLPQLHCLPLKLEEMPEMRCCFDLVLCMGILYHRRSPLDTLLHLHQLMVPGGRLVLETLILGGDSDTALFPRQRYGKMKNVFFIPTVRCLSHWLSRTGFTDIHCVDISPTTLKEQHKTDWVDTESLADFLDPEDPSKTVEGYPAPVRAMVLATAQKR